MLVTSLSTHIPAKSAGDLKADGSVALTADWDVGANEIRMETLYLDVADGTAPMTVVSTTVVANLNADQVDGLDSTDLLLVDGSQALSANWDAGSFQIRAETFQSDVTTGTAPLTVASTTLVSNLNADLLDGNEAAVFALADGTRWTTTNTANRLPISDGSGNLVVSSVTDTEAGYLSGVTSAIQTQLNGKAASSHNHAASDITSGTLAHERGGIEADISAIAIGDVIAGSGAGTAALVTATGHVRHSKLTIQSSGAADWESPTAYEETDGATVTFNTGNGLDQFVVLDGNRTLALNTTAINAMPNGTKFTIKLTQDGVTGSRTVTWFSGISWAGGSAPTLTTTAGKSDRFIFVKTGTGAYEGYVVGQNI